jgi:hypothetical protein
MGVADKRGAQFKPGKMTASRMTIASKKGSTGGGGSANRVGSPPMSPGAQRNRGLKSRAASRRGTVVGSRLTLSKQSKRRKMAAKLSALKLPVVAVVDPDDPRYDGVAVAGAVELSTTLRATLDVNAFTSENEFGETVIDMTGVERQRAASIGSSSLKVSSSLSASMSPSEPSILDESDALSNPIGEFEHWFENLSVSSDLSQMSSLSSVETQDTNDVDDLAFLDNVDEHAFLDSPAASDSSEISSLESDVSSFNYDTYDTWSVVKDASLSLLSSLSSWSWSHEESSLSNSSASSESDTDVELEAFLDAAKGWL